MPQTDHNLFGIWSLSSISFLDLHRKGTIPCGALVHEPHVHYRCRLALSNVMSVVVLWSEHTGGNPEKAQSREYGLPGTEKMWEPVETNQQ
jgi:hypothetical protein